MKRLSFWACLCASALLACTLNACSDDDPVVPETPVQPEEPSEPEEPVIAQFLRCKVLILKFTGGKGKEIGGQGFGGSKSNASASVLPAVREHRTV